MSESKHPAEVLFSEGHPLTAALNMKFIPVGESSLRVELDAPESFADSNGSHTHSGFSTLLLDTVLGSCAIGKLEKMQPIATIKLTCNHLRRIIIGDAIYCLAEWNGEENSVSFVGGEIRRQKDDQLLSTAIGTFMIGTASRPLAEKSGEAQ
ncbi:MAG: PaaI family thioesterase [Rhizobiaceae bacterium]|nr:PaaI family thioesterase [Rhizobiaceae bacterium]